MKLSVAGARMPYSWADFHTSALDETDADRNPEPPVSSSPFAGLVDYVSEVRIRAAVRADAIARRAR